MIPGRWSPFTYCFDLDTHSVCAQYGRINDSGHGAGVMYGRSGEAKDIMVGIAKEDQQVRREVCYTTISGT